MLYIRIRVSLCVMTIPLMQLWKLFEFVSVPGDTAPCAQRPVHPSFERVEPVVDS